MDEVEESVIVENSNDDCKEKTQLSKTTAVKHCKDDENGINSQISDVSDEKEGEEEGEIEEELIVGEDGEIEEEGEIEEGEALDEDKDENINKNDIEDGEIDDVSAPEMQNKQNCRFFQQGKCLYGRDCRYLHLSDKGLYHMFDSPLKYRRHPPPIPPFMNEVFINLPMPLPPPPLPPPAIEKEHTAESVWDKALYEAKERIKQSKMKKDADYSDNKLHMTVRNDWSRSKRSRSISPYDRSISPIPISEKVGNNSFNRRITENKFERKDYANKTRGPPLERKTYDNRGGRDLEWCDPWRRSKTPPKRKRRSFSASSKSSISSRSSWESSGKDYRSPSPKRRNTRKHSFRSSESPYRRSSRGSMSSHSRSSSSSGSSSGDKRRHTKKKIPSYNNVVLPFYKHHSVSPSRKTSFQKAAPVEKKKPQTPSPRRRSRSRSSSKSSAGRAASAASSRSRSYSDVSVSNISDSSLSDKSNSSNKSKNKTVSERVKFKIYNPNSRVITAKSSEILKGNPTTQSKPIRTVSAIPESRIQSPAKNKKINALEMELLKYQNTYRKKSVSPEKPVESPTKTAPELPISVRNIKKEKVDDISHDAPKVAYTEPPRKKPSKRDLLIQQLKAVEEAIARKKKAS